MDDHIECFPLNGLLPKKETEALTFINKYPKYDGRNTIIAILDTGIDPGAPGLQKTSDSKVKIIDLIDATGAGNVDISTTRQVNDEGYIIGLSERKLKIPKTWSNPSGKYYVGIKAIFDLYPSGLRDRIKKERREKLWIEQHENALSMAQKRINEFNATINDTNKTNLDTILTKEDLQTQYDVIKDVDNRIKDSGPIYDCIVWKNEDDIWCACVDTSECGDLDKCDVLTNYKDSHKYATFSHLDMFNYSVRIMPDESILQIVTDSGSHGTHVAAIAAAYYSDDNELNGVAPGAQIIGIKIGDSRLNGMETGYAFVNAFKYIIEYKCNLVNVSFGEPISFCNQGPVLAGFEELVDKYGCVVCISAGNNGPGIETCNAPAAYSNYVLSVGAYVTTDMVKSDYALLTCTSPKSMLFTWSSRGPTIDGAAGVSICAPGGAIASIPNWTLGCRQLMNGTSMSSPNCCGSIALILSGLIANGINYFPFGVQRALENTCLPLNDDLFGSGNGLIQIDKAYEYLRKYEDDLLNKVTFLFKCGPKSTRGIYLKTVDECAQTRDYSITIEPKFASCDFIDKNKFFKAQIDKISLNLRVALVCDSGWVECPKHIYLTNQQRLFYIRIRANELEHDKCYRTYVKGYDCDDPLKLCLFKIPITIIKPYIFNGTTNDTYEISYDNVCFKQGQIYRHFIQVPYGATHAEINFDCKQQQTNRDHTPLFYIQTTQFEKYRSYTDNEQDELYRLNVVNNFKYVFKCKSNKIVQISICKNWSNIGESKADYKIKFFGLYPNTTQSIYCLSSEPTRIDINCLQESELCEPTISYKYQLQPLRPTENQIELYRARDGPLKSIYQLILTYTFHQTKSGEVGFESPLLSNFLYENDYQSIFWSLFESNTKRLLVNGDAFPLRYKYAKSIDKGDYTVKLHIRHEKYESLDKLKQSLVLYLRQTISGTIPQDVYVSYSALMKGTKRSSGGNGDKLYRHQQYTLYLDSINDDKLPKPCEKGHLLKGEICFYKDSTLSKIDTHEIIYEINDYAPKTNGNTSNNNKNNNKSDEEKMNEAIRDLKISYVLKCNDLYDKLLGDYSDYIPLHLNRIKYLEQQLASQQQPSNNDEKSIENKEKYEQIIDLCKLALSKLNQTDILAYFGAKKQLDSVSDDTIKKEMESQRNWIIELLSYQGIAIIERSRDLNEMDLNEVKSIYKSLLKWTDLNDDKISKFLIKYYTINKFYGKKLKLLFKQVDDKPTVLQDKQILDILVNNLQLNYVNYFYNNDIIMKYQKSFAKF